MRVESRDAMETKTRIITISTIAFLGVVCITSGIIMPLVITFEPQNTIKFTITQKRVAKAKTTEIKLKDMESEVNTPLSVDINDYLDSDLDDKIRKALKLDTSAVNVTQAGSYTYTITYKKKTYNGTYIIKEKPLPTIDTMTLKTLKLTKGATLSTDLSTYIVETLPEEAKIAIKLNLANVNVNAAGSYQYTVTYNGKLYTGIIEIYEPQITLPSPSPSPTTPDTTQKDDSKENNTSNPQTQTP